MYIISFFFLVRHWNEFIKKEDLQKLAQSGITHLRIPLGYWILSVEEKEPFPEPPKNDNHGQRFYLKRLVKWANELGKCMRVLSARGRF